MTNGIAVDVEGGPIAEDVSSAVTAAAAQSPVVSEPDADEVEEAEAASGAGGVGAPEAGVTGFCQLSRQLGPGLVAGSAADRLRVG